MSAASSQVEATILQTLLPELEAEGFEVFLWPSGSLLPRFLSGFRPDAIAFKGDRKVAIEVVADRLSQAKTRRLQALFAGHPDWELRVVVADPNARADPVPQIGQQEISAHLDRVAANHEALGGTGAILAAWAALEAAARLVVGPDLGTPQTASRLVELLAARGYVSPDEADLLRTYGRLRNQAAHGRLDVEFPGTDVSRLVGIVRAVLETRESEVAAIPT